MLNYDEIVTRGNNYFINCSISKVRPTFNGLSKSFGFSRGTLLNYRKCSWNGHRYSKRNPSATRCVDNNDFHLIWSFCDEIKSRKGEKNESN